MKIAIAGGGTGGHLFPALAVGEVLRERGHEVLIFISEKEVDAQAIQGRGGEFRFEKLPSVGLSRAVFTFLRRALSSFLACRRIFAGFRPDVVLGMGGFTSTPLILAGKWLGARTFIHESNAIPGKANRLNARIADAVLLGFEECQRYFPRARCKVTGTPIRRSLAQRLPREEALAVFGLQAGIPTLFVMGGSQGAHGINEALRGAAAELVGLQVIHLAGANDAPVLEAAYRAAGVAAHVASFCHRMEAAYSAADLVVARSGAASLAEIAHFSLPSLLIPLPTAAENHQQFNAEIFARAGAAELLREMHALARTIHELIHDRERLAAMADACRILAPKDAAACVAETIEKLP